ncbi:DUF3987 domain-containing protein [Epilithonimonas hominis]|uniref:DUF3987 domain-containing protein n=1 Tax=Epilithonimonas hominis TaxID=420404 RepID=UPI00289CEAF1|nr:DUF3987 domain-containing protein [Epilithonimonas hominis]
MVAIKDLGEKLKNSLSENSVPLHVFPTEVQELIAEKAKQNIPIEFLFGSVLSCVSGAIGNTFRVELIYGMPTNASFWIAVNADSGDGKTEGIESFLKPLLKIESENFQKYKEAEKEYKEELQRQKSLPQDQRTELEKPIRQQRVIQDITAEAFADRMQKNPNGLIGYVDEIKGFVTSQGQYKGGNGNDRQFWLSVWNGKNAQKDRVDNSIYVEKVFFSIIGGIQKEEAKDLFGKMITDGFAPRFLFIAPDNVQEMKWSLEPVDRSKEPQWEAIIRRIVNVKTDPENNIVRFTPDAGKKLVEWRNSQKRSTNYTTRLFDAKLQIYSIRFALVLHTLKRACENNFFEDDLIEIETTEKAISLVEYFRSQALKMIEKMNLDDPLENLDATKLKLYDLLPEEFTTSEGEQISIENDLLKHSAFSVFLKNKRLFEKITKGVYRKLITDEND